MVKSKQTLILWNNKQILTILGVAKRLWTIIMYQKIVRMKEEWIDFKLPKFLRSRLEICKGFGSSFVKCGWYQEPK